MTDAKRKALLNHFNVLSEVNREWKSHSRQRRPGWPWQSRWRRRPS